jgi:hypothetical protein
MRMYCTHTTQIGAWYFVAGDSYEWDEDEIDSYYDPHFFAPEDVYAFEHRHDARSLFEAPRFVFRVELRTMWPGIVRRYREGYDLLLTA